MPSFDELVKQLGTGDSCNEANWQTAEIPSDLSRPSAQIETSFVKVVLTLRASYTNDQIPEQAKSSGRVVGLTILHLCERNCYGLEECRRLMCDRGRRSLG
jgi:hypothetical protein